MFVPTSLAFILVLTSGAALEAQVLDPIYVDQYMPLRSELMTPTSTGYGWMIATSSD